MATETNEPKAEIVEEKIEDVGYVAAATVTILTAGVCLLAYKAIRTALAVLNGTAE